MTITQIATDIHDRTGWTGKKLELAVCLYGIFAGVAANNTKAVNHFIRRADKLAGRDEQARVILEMRRAAA